VFPGDFADKKGSVHFNARHQSSDNKFKMNMGASYVMDRNNLVSTDLLSSALTLSPNAPALYNADGLLNWEGSTWFNPLSYTRQSYLGRTRQLLSNIDLGYKFSKHWQVRITGGYNLLRLEEDNLQPSSSYNPVWGVPGFAMFSTSEQSTWLVEPQLLYNHKVGRWQFDALIGSSVQETRRTGQRIDARNFTSDAVISNPAAAGSVTVLDVIDTRYRYASVYGRVKLDWDHQLLLSLTGRRDGSSRFGPGKQFGVFGAAGAGWLMSNAKWFPKKVISYAKLRASYGSTGNDQIDDYGYLSLWRFANYPYDGMPALQPQNLSNPDYRWETNRKAEAGIELGAWKDRVLFSVSYYRNRSDNQLLGYPLPLVTGFPTVQYNLPAELQNSGWELELSSVNLQHENWNWTTSANLSFPRSRLLSYPGLEGSAYGRDYVIGEPINIRRSLQHLGVDPVTGIYHFEDVNKDGQIRFPADAQSWSPMYVKAFAGLSNQLRFKNWLLDVFIQGVVQEGYTFQRYFQMPGTASNQPRYVLDRWREPGDQANYQGYSQSYGSDAYAAFAFLSIYGDDVIADASYVRLKNVSLSYSFPVNMLRRIRCQQWQFYAQGQNLLTWTNYKGLDPETMRYRNLPPLKTWVIGTKFTF
jgi:TonB-linked SusC/RagA family outer membrane protein